MHAGSTYRRNRRVDSRQTTSEFDSPHTRLSLIDTFPDHLEQALLWLDLAGVAVFAISGALVASRKCMDPVGFALIATITGIGGGTLRDLLLGQDVFWIHQPHYVGLCASVALMVYLLAPHIEYRYRILLWADAAGISLYCVLGARLAIDSGASGAIAIVMGLLTATFGGLIRDVLCNEIPLILRNEIYATAALIGALVYVVLETAGLPYGIAELGGVGACFMTRALGLIRGLTLPGYRPRAGREYPVEGSLGQPHEAPLDESLDESLGGSLGESRGRPSDRSLDESLAESLDEPHDGTLDARTDKTSGR